MLHGGVRRVRGTTVQSAGGLRRPPGRCSGPAREADVEPVPHSRRHHCPWSPGSRLQWRPARRPGASNRRRAGHDDLRGPRRRDAAVRAHAARRAAAASTITLGGAVTGLGIESSSFRNGLPHESVLELEVMTGDGRVIVATAATTSTRACSTASPTPTARSATRCGSDRARARAAVRRAAAPPLHRQRRPLRRHGRGVRRTTAGDFVDGTVFGRGELYLTIGRFVPTAARCQRLHGDGHLLPLDPAPNATILTVHDYLWRWDTDWFWCSRAFGVQQPRLRRLWPQATGCAPIPTGSSSRWDRRYQLSAGTPAAWPCRARDGRAGHRGADRAGRRVPRVLRSRDRHLARCGSARCGSATRRRTWDLYASTRRRLYVNFGFWSSVPLQPGERDGHRQPTDRGEGRSELGGRKSLYCTAFYEEDEFWELYGGSAYELLKKTYDPDGRLLDLYEKCVSARR